MGTGRAETSVEKLSSGGKVGRSWVHLERTIQAGEEPEDHKQIIIFKQEELESVGEFSEVCSENCLEMLVLDTNWTT